MQQKKQFSQNFKMLGIALIVVRNRQGKYLGVLEGKNRGWWY
jgi:hypothetical protein